MDWFSMVREIKITKHVNLLLPLKDLEKFPIFQKQQLIQSCELYLTKLEAKLALDHLIKFVLHKMNYNFSLRSNLITSTEAKLSLWSK
jgi:hypothetical protein